MISKIVHFFDEMTGFSDHPVRCCVQSAIWGWARLAKKHNCYN